ncbi:MAG: hypothetical protein KDE24_27585, partial [Caldilinea sp.]|nr:hypothetical protein [Caldilinea sp.]
MKTRWSILTLFLIAAMVVAACAAPAAAPAPAQDAAPAEATEPAAAEAAAPSGDAITLEFWHAMGGNLGEVVQELVDRFNA